MNMRDSGDYVRNMALAAIAGQAGCLTAFLVLVALLGGLFLDELLGTRPVFTLGLVLLSVPVSLVLMVYTVLSTTRRMTPPNVRSSPPSTSTRYDDEDL